MLILGLESSCDETSAAVVEMDEKSGVRKILSDIVVSQVDIHKLYGGVVPEIASRAHVEAVSGITYEALKQAGAGTKDVGAVAVTACPGLIGALLVGVNFAKSLAFSHHIPLVPVNHICGHVAAAYLCDPELKPPHLALVVSGGHTALYDVKDFTVYETIGTTRDDAAGEAFDKIARVMGMPYPGGAALDKMADGGDPHAFALPSPALGGDGFDFSFSGIKTAALNLINGAQMRGEQLNQNNLAASYVHTIVTGIAKKTAAALDKTGYGQMVLAGGVAANAHLRAEIAKVCQVRGVKLTVPPLNLCGDNAAMIAAAGYYAYEAGARGDTFLNASAADTF